MCVCVSVVLIHIDVYNMPGRWYGYYVPLMQQAVTAGEIWPPGRAR